MNNKIQQTSNERQATSNEPSAGSALILTVVLTSLLAIVGVLFLMVSRLDKMATSGLSENKELNLAVESVIAKISQELALDVPGAAGQEYYDYPDVNNIWLACLEPYEDAGDYYWRQISDVYGRLDVNALDLQAKIIDDYQPSITGGLEADADGDGVADSVWVAIPDMNSGKGKPIYAAVRIVDNGGMLNVNTAYKFNPNDTEPNIDGSSQMQINLMALSWHPSIDFYDANDEMDLLYARNPLGLIWYERDVIWRYGDPNGTYTPFDISDELELRYRFLLNHTDIDTRLEEWGGEFRKGVINTPVDTVGNLPKWFKRAYDSGNVDPNYAYRHIATTYNMDRIITPRGPKMVNVNNIVLDEPESLYDAIMDGFKDADFNGIPAFQTAAQIAVNLIDFADSNNTVTVFHISGPNAKDYYGFEAQPFISEIGFQIDGSDPETSTNNYFALELYNPFEVDIPLGDFRLELRLAGVLQYTVNLAGYIIAANSHSVITNAVEPNFVLATYIPDTEPETYVLNERYDIYLMRGTLAGDICLDKQRTNNVDFRWSTVNGMPQFYYRPDNNWNIVYQEFVYDSNGIGTLRWSNGGGTKRNYNIPTFTGGFVTVGDIARVLIIGPSTDNTIGEQLAEEPDEELVRLDLQDEAFQQLFNYLTVFDPTVDGIDNNGDGIVDVDPNEVKIPGRINVNTAPWFVIAQLPWVSQREAG